MQVTVHIEGMEPTALFQNWDGEHKPMPEGLFIHIGGIASGHGSIAMTLQGPLDAVTQFIADNWGDDEVESMREWGSLPTAS